MVCDDKSAQPDRVQIGAAPARDVVRQRDVRRPRWQHVLHLQRRGAAPGLAIRLDETGRWQRPGYRVAWLLPDGLSAAAHESGGGVDGKLQLVAVSAHELRQSRSGCVSNADGEGRHARESACTRVAADFDGYGE